MMRLVLIGLIFLEVGTLLVVVLNYDVRREIPAREEMLNTFIVPRVEYKEEFYEIREEGVRNSSDEIPKPATRRSVLRVAHFATESRIDPLFAIPGTDLTNLERSIEDLQDTVETILISYKADEQELIRNTLHPFDFLLALNETEALRRELVARPSEKKVVAYTKAINTTISLYQEYIHSLKTVLQETATGKFENGIFNFSAGITDVERMTTILDLYLSEADAQQKKSSFRQKCYRGVLKACSPIEYPSFSSETKNYAPNPLSSSTQEIFEVIREYRKGDPLAKFHDEVSIVRLESSECFPEFSPVAFYFWWEVQPGEGLALRPELVSDIYFIDTHDELFSGRVYYTQARDSGIRYLYQPAANHYLCQELALDFSVIAKMLFLRDSLAATNLFKNQKMKNESIAELQTLSDSITANSVLDQSLTDYFMTQLGKILVDDGEQELSNSAGEEEALFASELYTAYALGSPHFDQLIWSAVNNNLAVQDIVRSGPPIELPALFYTRSYPKLLLGSFNKSIVREDLSSIVTPNEATLHWFRSYKKSLGERYSPNEILSFLVRAKATE